MHRNINQRVICVRRIQARGWSDKVIDILGLTTIDSATHHCYILSIYISICRLAYRLLIKCWPVSYSLKDKLGPSRSVGLHLIILLF